MIEDYKRMLEEESKHEAGTADSLFTKNSPRNLPIVQAANHPESLKLLLAAGADPNVETNDGDTALFKVLLSEFLTLEKKRELASILVKGGADINYSIKNHESSFADSTVLCELVHRDETESIKLAIELGADVSKACNDNENILEQTNNPEIIQILKAAGAKGEANGDN